ncbi:MAG: nucleotide exchange factor GrpE [Clostridia bacterium]|nr:nucleotide exchange factor GrpE [Clostridia bacterium]
MAAKEKTDKKSESAVKDKAESAKEKKQDKAKAAAEEKTEDNPVEVLKKQYDELNDKYMRMLAEYDNYRKRTAKELDARSNNAKVDLISKLLPVMDNFERAAGGSAEDPEAYKKGVEMIARQFRDTIIGMGIEEFGEKGEQFDPNIHTAVMHEENDELEDNVITEVFMKGYKLGDRIVRHAAVKVAN